MALACRSKERLGRLRVIRTGSPTGCAGPGRWLAALWAAGWPLLVSCNDGAAQLETPSGVVSACLSGAKGDCKPVAELASESVALGQVSSAMSDSSATLQLDVGSVAMGKDLTRLVTLSNSGDFDLPAGYRIGSVRMLYSPGSPAEGDVQALECWSADGTKRCEHMDSQWRLIVPKGYAPKPGQTTAESFAIRFKAFDNKPRSALVRIGLQGIGLSALTFTLHVATKSGTPKANWLPKDVSFPYVPPKHCATQEVQLVNTGGAVLAIDSIDLAGIDNSFQLLLTDPPGVDSGWHHGGTAWTLVKPLQVAVGGSALFQVMFCPASDNQQLGHVKLVGNDASAPALSVAANSSVPCIAVSPTWLQFGSVAVGSQSPMGLTVKNCGSQELLVHELQLTEDKGDAYQEFLMDLSGLVASGKLDAPPPLSAENPLKLGVNEQATIDVNYAPANVNQAGTQDTGEIRVLSNAYAQPVIKLQGN